MRPPKKEEYLLMDVFYRLLIYFRENEIDLNLDDMVMFTKKFFAGFEWEHEFAKIMYKNGFITIKLSPQIPKSKIVESGDVFDFLLMMGNKRFGVECKSRIDPLLISRKRIKSQMWLATALNLDDLLIAWRTGDFWFLISVSLLKRRVGGSLGISREEVIKQILREVGHEDSVYNQKFNGEGKVIAGGVYRGPKSDMLTFEEILNRYAGQHSPVNKCKVCKKETPYTCKVCGQPICLKHAVICEIEGEIYCPDCASPIICKKCGRKGCTQCITSKGICMECLLEEESKIYPSKIGFEWIKEKFQKS
ncbi:MAG: hypothetical protein ACP6IU_02170 [Candidatus Asgardarchaeia archaeon]